MARKPEKSQPGAPPGSPWRCLEAAEPPTGYLSFYFSDDLSPLPVRHITRAGDCKSDPNIETGTFGLFSTCEPNLRSGLVNSAARYLFFLTTRPGLNRVAAGFYRIAW